MTFFPEPIRPSEGREDDEYRVNPIEADRHAKKSLNINKEERKKRVKLYGAFLLFFKNLIDKFDGSDGKGARAVSNEGLPSNIREFKVLLQKIQTFDQSTNSQFCQQLSETWVQILQGVQVLSHIRKKSEINVKKLSDLIIDIDRYPSNEEHKLGYYLSHYAGESWLPFPFRDILKQLNSDHIVNQKNSILSQWIQLMEDLLQS